MRKPLRVVDNLVNDLFDMRGEFFQPRSTYLFVAQIFESTVGIVKHDVVNRMNLWTRHTLDRKGMNEKTSVEVYG
jgi:hypothetical protein